jgi:hypothetical protein
MDSKETNYKTSLIKSTEQTYINLYINTFNEKEKHAYEIARDHLGMSFQVEKSIGYIQWKKENISD